MYTTSEIKSKYFALVFTISIHAILFLLFLVIEFVNPGQLIVSSASAEPSDYIGLDISSSSFFVRPQEIKSSISLPAKVISENKNNIISHVIDPNKTLLNATTNVLNQYPEKGLQSALAKLDAIKNNHGNKNANTTEGDFKDIGNDIEKNKSVIPESPSAVVDLTGRILIKRPEALTDSKEEGVVVVEIIVDENGDVIKAAPGQRGSTTTSIGLLEKAKQKAIQAKFNPSAAGMKEQRGTYTFVFTLQ